VVAYHLDAELGLGVRYFELDNEPEGREAGHPGSEATLVETYQLGADAVRAAVVLANPRVDAQILGPVVERPDSPLLGFLLRAAPQSVDVVTYHRYQADPDLHAAGVLTVDQLDAGLPSGPRPVFVTEWATRAGLKQKPDPNFDERSLSTALADARIIRAYALAGVDGIFQFKLERTAGYPLGLLDVADSGDHAIGGPTRGYFAHRMLARATAGRREILQTADSGAPLEALATRLGPDQTIVTIINPDDAAWRLRLASRLGPLEAGPLRLLDATHNDAVVGDLGASPATLRVPSRSILQVELRTSTPLG
jgi:hypothetical protein